MVVLFVVLYHVLAIAVFCVILKTVMREIFSPNLDTCGNIGSVVIIIWLYHCLYIKTGISVQSAPSDETLWYRKRLWFRTNWKSDIMEAAVDRIVRKMFPMKTRVCDLRRSQNIPT